jgi:hypothetical protein
MDTYIIQKYQKLVWILIHLKPKGWSCLNVIHVKQLFKTKNGYLFLTSLCTFPRKSLLAMVVVSLIILIHASQFPCDHSHHWDPSNHSYPSHLSIRDSNGIDPTTFNPSHLFNHNGDGLCVLSNQISLSYAKVFR